MSGSLRVLLGLLTVSLFALGVTGNALYSQLAYLLIFLLAGSWVWSRLALRGVQVYRMTRLQRAQAGQVLGERFIIRNNSRIPILWLEVEDHSDLPASRGSRVFTRIRGRQSQFYLSRTRLLNRGSFTLGPTKVLAGDVFGFFQVSRTFLAEKSLLVYPYMVDLHTFPNPAGFLIGGEALRRKTHQITPNAAGVREYVSGDSISRIHWKSSARRNKLMVKEFELDPKAEVWMFLDMHEHAQAGLLTADLHSVDKFWMESETTVLSPSTEEYAISIIASIARYYLIRGRAVGLVSSALDADLFSPDRGSQQLEKILEFLALVKAKGEIPFHTLIAREAQQIPRGSTVVLVTPSVDPQIVLGLDQMMRLGLHPVVVLLDAESFGGLAGTTQVMDTIKSMRIPVCRIENAADLAESLNQWGNETSVSQISRIGL